jgi:hypothetical protein
VTDNIGGSLHGTSVDVSVTSVNGDAISVAPQPETDLAAIATMTSSTSEFLAWSTKRLPWEPLVSIDGDSDTARRFLTPHLNDINRSELGETRCSVRPSGTVPGRVPNIGSSVCSVTRHLWAQHISLSRADRI